MIERPNRVAMAHAVVYFPSDTQVSAQGILRRLPMLMQRFDGEPLVIPRPAGAPPELPVLRLVNRATTENFTVSPARADFRADLRSSTGSSHEILSAFFVEAKNLFLGIRDPEHLQVTRLAAVTHRFSEHPNPALELARQFCREDCIEPGPLNRPEAFELHAHKRFFSQLLGVEVNSWVRNRSALLTPDNTPVVYVEQDVNTLDEATPGTHFDAAAIERFFSAVVSQFDETLALYYK